MERSIIEQKINEYCIEIYKEDPTKLCARRMPSAPEANRAAKEFIRDNKSEIMAVLKAREERAARRKKIEEETGYTYIERLASDWSSYRYAEKKAFEREEICRKRPPKETVEAARERYPKGSAYMSLVSMRYSNNYIKSNIGSKALDRIVDGEDPIDVLKEAEAEWSREAARLVDNM